MGVKFFRKFFVLTMMLTVCLGVYAQKGRTVRKKTSVTRSVQTPEQKVLGKHKLSLQWISWDYFGVCNVKKNPDGTLWCTGQQLSRENDDYLRIDGMIEIVDAKNLRFTGTIAMKVYHINNGEECVREGTFDFKASGNRKYWRLQQMTNPCDECCDYVDIYFR